ncbi:MAG: type IV toxin-antitoxin system AbiEi family antitoxin domain-containing protein [Thermoleophilaceae bacterium]
MADFDLGYRRKAQPRRNPAIATFAGRQYGVVSYRQLLALGLGPAAIQRWVEDGRLHRVHRGVYAVGHTAVMPRGRWYAAVLACGPEALLSHRSAAALWELRADASGGADVSVPGASRRSRSGIRLHRTRSIDARDRAIRYGIPVTSVARTLLDLAVTVAPREFERAFEEADRRGRVSVATVERLLERSPGHHGAGPLAALVAEDRAAAAFTRSELEACFLTLCRDAGLPRPLVNVRVAGYEVDAVWPQERLVVELDGYAFHRTRRAFERDRAKDAVLQRAGYRVVRVTYRMLAKDPAAVAATVWSVLQSPAASSLV